VMVHKFQACGLLIETVLRWERQLDLKVKCVRTENGGEFCSDILSDFLLTRGIKAERALLYHHYQNQRWASYANRSKKLLQCSVALARFSFSALTLRAWGKNLR
jgi:hypothetical protein